MWQTGRMKRPHASDDVRERALAAVDGGRRVADVAAFSQNDPSTIRRWIRQRVRIGSGWSRPRSGRPRLLGASDAAALQAQVVSHPDATLAEHCSDVGGRAGDSGEPIYHAARAAAAGDHTQKRP